MTILRFLPFSFTVEAETKMVWDLCPKRKLPLQQNLWADSGSGSRPSV
jgi:hypothetical protein